MNLLFGIAPNVPGLLVFGTLIQSELTCQPSPEWATGQAWRYWVRRQRCAARPRLTLRNLALSDTFVSITGFETNPGNLVTERADHVTLACIAATGRFPLGSFQHPRSFQPLELEIIDYVYEAAWAQLEARNPFRDRDKDWMRQAVLRKQIIHSTGTDRIEFDTLYEKVLRDMPGHWAIGT